MALEALVECLRALRKRLVTPDVAASSILVGAFPQHSMAPAAASECLAGTVCGSGCTSFSVTQPCSRDLLLLQE